MVRPPDERTLERALADLDDARAALADDPEFAGLGMTPAEWDVFHSEAADLVRNYFLLEDPTAVTPIGLELLMSAQVGSVTVRGIIDRLELDENGDLVVTDYKTGKAPREGFEKQKLGGVEFYALLCEEMLGPNLVAPLVERHRRRRVVPGGDGYPTGSRSWKEPSRISVTRSGSPPHDGQ